MRGLYAGVAFNFWGQTVLAVLEMAHSPNEGLSRFAWLTLASFTFGCAVHHTREAIRGEGSAT